MPILPSSRPGDAVKIRILVLSLDLLEQVPGRGAIREVVAGQAAFVATGMELANYVSLTIAHVPYKRARVTFSGADFGASVASVVDAKLGDRLDASIFLSEGNESSAQNVVSVV